MKYYPLNLNIKNRNCLVVGGGSVGARKASTLIKCGGVTTIISPEFSSAFNDFNAPEVTLIRGEYSRKYLEDMFLVIGTTDDAQLNLKISRDAEETGILCNIADNPDKSDFILPSIVNKGDLLITISTSGTSPAMAKKIKKHLNKEFGEEYADFLLIMGKIRKRLLSQNHAPDEHKKIFRELINSELLKTIKDKDYSQTNDLLNKILGKGYTYENLAAGDLK